MNSKLKLVPKEFFSINPNAYIPNAFDWRERSSILTEEVRDQGSCGSCYAHSTLQVIEAQLAIQYNKSVKLSVQEIIECAGDHGTNGCKSGSIEGVFSYINAQGISLDEDYPQTEVTKSCNKNPKRLNITIEKYKYYYNENEDHVKAALYSFGPLLGSYECSHETFFRYSNGLFYEPDCINSLKPDHASIIIGYGSENGVDFWTIKNSYGAAWGENGYIRIARNKKFHCKVGLFVAIPVVKMR